jgi:protease PrsW
VGAVALAGHGDSVRPVIATFLLRGFLAGVWSHTLFGALAGAGIGYLVVRADRTLRARIGVAALAVLGAWASHVLWNSPLLRDGLGDGAVALLAVLVLKGLPPLLLILLLVRAAHDREAAYYTGQLATLGDPELITPGELRVLRSGSARSAARAHARARAGPKARSAVRRLQRAQARLAVELSRASGDAAGPAVAGRIQEVRRERSALAALGLPEATAPAEAGAAWRRTASRVGTMALAVAVVWAAITALGGA